MIYEMIHSICSQVNGRRYCDSETKNSWEDKSFCIAERTKRSVSYEENHSIQANCSKIANL
jgi:hypothetical protein